MNKESITVQVRLDVCSLAKAWRLMEKRKLKEDKVATAVRKMIDILGRHAELEDEEVRNMNLVDCLKFLSEKKFQKSTIHFNKPVFDVAEVAKELGKGNEFVEAISMMEQMRKINEYLKIKEKEWEYEDRMRKERTELGVESLEEELRKMKEVAIDDEDVE